MLARLRPKDRCILQTNPLQAQAVGDHKVSLNCQRHLQLHEYNRGDRNFSGLRLHEVDLRGTPLSGIDLSRADLL